LASNDATVTLITLDDSTATVLADASSSREGLIIYAADADIKVKFGPDCADDDYSIVVKVSEFYEMQRTIYCGEVTAYVEGAAHYCFVTDISG
jgi:hypothetical protein